MSVRPEEAEIRKSLDALVQAIRSKDIDALMQHYAPEVIVFDIRPPHRIKGVRDYQKNFEAWFASVDGPIDYEVVELDIKAEAELALCHSLSHVRSKRTNGEIADYWVRVTSGLRKSGGRWIIAHEHVSMPINLQTMTAHANFSA